MKKMVHVAAKRWWSALNGITKFIMGAMTAKLFHVEITGKRRDTETVMRRLEGGDWKSAITGNSLTAYPNSRTVL